ncbi:Xre family transcriptional regulator [Breoghania corrubedonensis]|uniref:Xre family transcriptional regulator n=1 Tax=Breoghania corrubedonensis TaxID=665038 RepID=A0A2T5VEZ4_9HYPH|nr:XRE family transcriptional regulator [Breoghania corrubedonensis]PTW62318.1 Xre family transcriptional regulator [Breoghania corrubedonensis]
MRDSNTPVSTLDARIAERLKALRGERGWSLETLSTRSGVSRATLSRLENGDVSPTTAVLARLCAAYGMTLSRLMLMAEETFTPLVPRDLQPEWQDAAAGFSRRSVSPPANALSGDVLECRLEAGADIAYEAPPREGLEHHLVLMEGALTVTVDGDEHSLSPGDCLRYRLVGTSRFQTPAETPARYFLFMV